MDEYLHVSAVRSPNDLGLKSGYNLRAHVMPASLSRLRLSSLLKKSQIECQCAKDHWRRGKDLWDLITSA